MPRVPGSSRKRVTLPDSSDESAAEVDDAGRDEDDEDDLPLLRSSTRQEAPRIRNEDDQNVSMPSSAKNLRSSQSVSTRLQKAVIISDDDEDEEDDDGLDERAPPGRVGIVFEEGEDEGDDGGCEEDEHELVLELLEDEDVDEDEDEEEDSDEVEAHALAQ